MDARIPAHLEVSALIRQTQAAGGFAILVKKGERDAGTILVVITENGATSRLYERMPQLDGSRAWHRAMIQDPENKDDFESYVQRRMKQDPDVWVVELDIADGERFIGLDSSPA